jgi:DNA-binding CsgD family transcriptional regulator
MMRLSTESVATTIGLVYEAAYDPSHWPDVLRAIGDFFGSSRSCICCLDARPGATRVRDSVGSAPDPELETFAAFQATTESALFVGIDKWPTGQVYRRRDVLDEDHFRNCDFWHDWLKPRQMDEAIVSNLAISGSTLWILDISRMTKFGEFQRRELELLRKITPHIARAGQIGEALEQTVLTRSPRASMSLGMLVVDPELRSLEINASAETLLSRNKGRIGLSRGRVWVREPLHAHRLAEMVLDACSTPMGSVPALGGMMLLPAQLPGESGLLVSVAPLAASQRFGLRARQCAIIMIRELDGKPMEGLEKALCSLFDLSPSEARLASAIAAGKSLNQAAFAAGITVSSARTYLARVFAKTGARQQSQLVILLKEIGALIQR